MGSLKELKNVQIIILGLCVSGATILSTLILSRGFMQMKKFSNEVITVTGSAEKEIVSDKIVWNLSFSRRSQTMTVAFEALKSDLKKVRNYLISKGIENNEMAISQISTSILYRKNEEGYSTNDIEGYLLTQAITITSYNVKKIDAVAREATELIDEDVQFVSGVPEFFYTKLSELKHEMLAQASKDARLRAEKMAHSVGNKIGLMRSARMGTFQINPINSYDVSWYGNNDISSYEKKVMAVVHIDFAIKE